MKKIFLLSVIIVLKISTVFSQIYEIELRNNKYNIEINENTTNKGTIYDINIYYPQTQFTVSEYDTTKNVVKFIKNTTIFKTFNTTTTQFNEININNIITDFFLTALANDTLFVYKNDSIIYQINHKNTTGTYLLDTINTTNSTEYFLANEKKKRFLKFNNKINEIDKEQILLETQSLIQRRQLGTANIPFDNEKEAGIFEINQNIFVYRNTLAININQIDQSLVDKYKLFQNLSIQVVVDTLNSNSNDTTFIFDFEIIDNLIKRAIDIKSTKTGKNKRILKRFIRKLKRIKRKAERAYRNSKRIPELDSVFSNNFIVDTVTINSVDFSVEDGTIRYLRAKGIGKNNMPYSFHNQVSIPLKAPKVLFYHYEDRLYNIYASNDNRNYYIKFGDLLTYDYTPQIYTEDFSPKDTVINVDFTKRTIIPCIIPVSHSSIHSIFNIRAYSDLTSLYDEPAGIFQTEASAHFTTNVSYAKNSSIVWFNYFAPYINYADFKDDFSGLPVMKENDTIKLAPLNLQRFSNLYTGLKINIFRGDIRKFSSSFHVNAFSDIFNTKTIDTIKSISTIDTMSILNYDYNKKNILSSRFGLEFLWKTMQFSTFGIDMSLSFYTINLLNSGDTYRFKQSNFTIEPTNYTNEYNIQLCYNWSMVLYYKPLSSKASSVFLRTGYYGALGDKFENRYLYIQLGYSLDISKLISKN